MKSNSWTTFRCSVGCDQNLPFSDFDLVVDILILVAEGLGECVFSKDRRSARGAASEYVSTGRDISLVVCARDLPNRPIVNISKYFGSAKYITYFTAARGQRMESFPESQRL